jgi:hypothetical protein
MEQQRGSTFLPSVHTKMGGSRYLSWFAPDDQSWQPGFRSCRLLQPHNSRQPSWIGHRRQWEDPQSILLRHAASASDRTTLPVTVPQLLPVHEARRLIENFPKVN